MREEAALKREHQKPIAPPAAVTFDYERESESLRVTVELPDADKDSIDLHLAVSGFCVEAESAETRYAGCYKFDYEVDPEAAAMNFAGGILSIKIPFFTPLCGKKFPIAVEQEEDDNST